MGITTYVRNDNSDEVYQVDSANTVNNAKRLNGLLERNRADLEQNNWLGVWYNPEDINTSYGITGSLSSANIRNLLASNIPRIVPGARKKEIRKNILAENAILFAL